MRKIFVSVYFWIGLIFIGYSIARGLLELSAHLPNDFSSTLITLTLLVLGAMLMVIAYRQVR